jgi:hypothetical protein
MKIKCCQIILLILTLDQESRVESVDIHIQNGNQINLLIQRLLLYRNERFIMPDNVILDNNKS